MRLKQINIENFRAIKNSTIRFRELTAVVGENNSGKTAILRALNSVFNYPDEERDFQSGAHRFAPRTITKITLVFSDIPERAEYHGLINSSGELHLKFTYNYSKSTPGRRLYYEKNGNSKQLETSFINVIKKDIDYIYP